VLRLRAGTPLANEVRPARAVTNGAPS